MLTQSGKIKILSAAAIIFPALLTGCTRLYTHQSATSGHAPIADAHVVEVCALHAGNIVFQAEDKTRPLCRLPNGQAVDALELERTVAKIMIEGDTQRVPLKPQ
ncbi:MAG: hypothetical protein Q4A62_10295 [Eikenella sp.]|nr:hypothetical protein [Eikenella sp.]